MAKTFNCHIIIEVNSIFHGLVIKGLNCLGSSIGEETIDSAVVQ